MYFPTRIGSTMISASNPPLSYLLCQNLTPQRKEIDSPFSYVYTAKYENQYSVVLLNCHSTSLSVTVFPSLPSNAGFHSYPDLLQRSISQSHDGATARDRDLARCDARLFNCSNCVSCYRCSPRLFHIQNSKTRFRGTTHIRHIDVCLVVIVIMKLVASVLQTAVIWITLNSSNVHIFLQTNNQLNFLSPDPAFSTFNSFITRCVDSLLLVTMFLMSCGWQITHQLVVVGVVASCDVGKRNPVWIVHSCRVADFERGFVVLRLAD